MKHHLFFFSALWLPLFYAAQTTLFSENMGSGGAGSNPLITAFAGFQNAGCTYTFAGSGDVRGSSPSSGYTGASGVNNVFLNSNRTFIVSGINTLGYSSISLSYGLNNSSILSLGPGFNVEVSTTGLTYTALTRPNTFWLLGGWLPETCTGTIPATQNLYIRFSNTSPTIDYRLDDVTLTGIPTASTNPTPYNGWPASYTFNNWPAASAPGTYPPNLVFHHAVVGTAQPVINDITASYNYANSYSPAPGNTCSSFMSGQGASGFSFAGRNPGNAASTGNLGEAVLALNTTCRSNIQVSWQAGTIVNNGTVYQISAQYRIGTSGSYTNLPNSNIAQIRYTSPLAPVNFGPITLPAGCENQPVVQVRWAYYWAGAGSGPGDEIFVTNINVSSSGFPAISAISNQSICGGNNTAAVSFSTTPAGATFSWTNSNTAIGLAAAGAGNIAAYATPTASAPPDKTGVITVTASLGGCASPQSFSITVKGPQPASTWNGSVSNNWFDHDNWSDCACSSITSATIPAVPGPGLSPVIGGTAAANVNSITLAAGALLSVQSTQTLNVYGSWSNNGSFVPQQGNVVLNGSSAQSIGGAAPTTFYHLTLNNTAGASLASPQEISGSLQLNNGILNTNDVLTLVSNAAGSGRIGPIAGSADIINQVTVQQYAPGGSTGWALLGSPISPALSMNDWNDDFIITCLSCPNGSLGGFTSIYSYDETIAGSYSIAAKYIPITTIANSLANGTGYWVYMGTGNATTTPITIDVTGTVAKSSCISCPGAVTLPVSRTNNTSTFDDGWNLLANPLPSPISWTALRNGNASVDNALYVYNADLGGGTGSYASYINGVSSTTIGGINDNIPMCQGFYVHTTASATLTAGENTKVNASPALLKSSTASGKPIARLNLSGAGNVSDAAVFYFEQGASINFEAAFDAYKLIYDAAQPYIGSMSDSLLTSINGLPLSFTTLAIPVKVITGTSGSYTLSLDASDFENNVCVTLLDTYTNISTNLITSSYACTLSDTTTMARFLLSFVSNPLAAGIAVAQPHCLSPVNGTIVAAANGAGPWDYTWLSGATVLKTSLAKNSADSLIAQAGSYSVKINTSGQCDNFSQVFAISSLQLPAAGFTIAAPIYMSEDGLVNFINTSVNSHYYLWDFGDASATSSSAFPSHYYAAPGTYSVLLLATGSSGCVDSILNVVNVTDDVTPLREQLNDPNTLILFSDNGGGYLLAMNFKTVQDVTVSLYDANGRSLKSSRLNAISTGTLPVDLETFAPGMYYLHVRTGAKFDKTFKLIH